MIIQLTGLSGAGKSTLASLVKEKFSLINVNVVIIDGDVYRKTLCKDLGFSKADRYENIRRLGDFAFKMSQQNAIVVLSVINPYEEIRLELKQKYQAKTVFIDCDLNTLFSRDTKGLYKRAMLSDNNPEKLYNLTGVNDIYEIPYDANLIIKTNHQSIEESVKKLYDYIFMNMK